MQVGCAYVPLDLKASSERLNEIVRESGIEIILRVSDTPVQIEWADGIEVISISEAIEKGKDKPLRKPVDFGGEQLTYLMFTSGSTGKPKGIAIARRGIERLVDETNFIEWNEKIVASHTAPTAFDASTLEIWGTLTNGGKLVIYDEEFIDIKKLGELIKREQITTVWLTTGLFHLMAEEGLDDLRNVKHILAGGDVISKKHVKNVSKKLPDTNLIIAYGPTENTTFTSCCLIDEWQPEWNTVPIGKPICGTTIYILDENMKPVAEGVIGEIYTGGEGVALGYWNQADLTAEKFVPDPFGRNGGKRLYRTGDLGRFLENGVVEFAGRNDAQVKIRGFRIELEEIENTIKEHAEIKEAVVTFIKDSAGKKHLAAHLVLKDGAEIETKKIKDALKNKLPEYMIPSRFLTREEIPLTRNGKIDRQKLAENIFIADEFAVDNSELTETEKRIAKIWKDVLGEVAIEAETNFFDVGGHSLAATETVNKLEREFEIEIELREIFENSRLDELSAKIRHLTEEGKTSGGKILKRKRDEQGEILSYSQQRLWFIDKLQPGSPLYNIPAAIRLRGTLQVEILEKCLTEIVRRHESLRTVFIDIDGKPKQVIKPPEEFKFQKIELDRLDKTEQERQLLKLAGKEANSPFDLENGPLIRASIVKLAEDDYAVLFTMHHIISDGWSTNILIEELIEFYNAFSTGNSPAIADLTIQYADYALWQRDWLKDDILKNKIDFWRNQLKPSNDLLNLPIDKPRSAYQGSRGEVENFVLSKEVSDKIEEISRQNNATVFMTCLTLFSIFLSKYTGDKDVSIGLPIAGRNKSGVENLIGFFVNTLVFRTKIADENSFDELVNKTREISLGIFSNQEIPFEMLVDELKVERTMSYTPLFQVSFSYQPPANKTFTLPTGLRVGPLVENAGNQTADTGVLTKFDISLSMGKNGETIGGTLVYNADLFDKVTIESFVKSFTVLIEKMVEKIEKPVEEINLLDETELKIFHEKLTGIQTENINTTFDIINKIISKLNENQDRSVFNKSQKELGKISSKLAKQINEKVENRNLPVLIISESPFEILAAIIACLKAGFSYLIIPPECDKEKLSALIERSNAALVLTNKANESLINETKIKILFIENDDIDNYDISDFVSKQNIQNQTNEFLSLQLDSENRYFIKSVSHREFTERLLKLSNLLKLSDEKILEITQTDSYGTELLLGLLFAKEINFIDHNRINEVTENNSGERKLLVLTTPVFENLTENLTENDLRKFIGFYNEIAVYGQSHLKRKIKFWSDCFSDNRFRRIASKY